MWAGFCADSQASAVSRSGAATASFWQRLRMVAGSRLGAVVTSITTASGTGFFQRLEQRVGRIAVHASAGSNTTTVPLPS